MSKEIANVMVKWQQREVHIKSDDEVNKESSYTHTHTHAHTHTQRPHAHTRAHAHARTHIHSLFHSTTPSKAEYFYIDFQTKLPQRKRPRLNLYLIVLTREKIYL